MGQPGAMVAGQRMVGGVPRSAHFAEQLRHLPREDALVLQAANQLLLRFFPRGEQADPGGDVLREEFGELAELQERRVGVVGEVALGEEAEAHQLFVVRAEHGEVGRGRVHGARFQCRARVAVGAAELRAQFTPMDGQFGPD